MNRNYYQCKFTLPATEREEVITNSIILSTHPQLNNIIAELLATTAQIILKNYKVDPVDSDVTIDIYLKGEKVDSSVKYSALSKTPREGWNPAIVVEDLLTTHRAISNEYDGTVKSLWPDKHLSTIN